MKKTMSIDIRYRICVYRINVVLSMIHVPGSVRDEIKRCRLTSKHRICVHRILSTMHGPELDLNDVNDVDCLSTQKLR